MSTPCGWTAAVLNGTAVVCSCCRDLKLLNGNSSFEFLLQSGLRCFAILRSVDWWCFTDVSEPICLRCTIFQKSRDLIYTEAKAWNHSYCKTYWTKRHGALYIQKVLNSNLGPAALSKFIYVFCKPFKQIPR